MGPTVILGVSLSHDASAALTNDCGRVIAAVGEERLSRLKNHRGLPVEAIRVLLKGVPIGESVSRIIVGSHEELPADECSRFLADLDNTPSNPRGTTKNVHPGWRLPHRESPQSVLEDVLRGLAGRDVPIVWQNHHMAHLGTALGINSAEPRLLLSLDGEGDGESGAIAVSDGSAMRVLARIPAADSIGLLYSAVTARYNFTPTRHEGKITGLAAFGSNSAAVDILRSFVKVRQGVPIIHYPKSFKARVTRLALRHSILSKRTIVTLDDIVDLAESQTSNYADLAYAIQSLLEETVCEIVDFWTAKTGLVDLALSGGVFANVRLNQRLAELPSTRSVSVFPNMGDGGLALGGIWTVLHEQGTLSREPLYDDMFLSPPLDPEHFLDEAGLRAVAAHHDLQFEPVERELLPKRIAHLIAEGAVVGWHEGRMEFGPRALGHRSILVDPRERFIVDQLNARLNRTEFMPFAPVVLRERFDDYFDTTNSTLQPFEYMTMTCNVREKWRPLLKAVTHVDGTARPQIIDRWNTPIYWDIVWEFGRLTGVYLLVNTSFNTHEEPINGRLEDSVRALLNDAVDILAVPGGLLRIR